MIRDLKAAIEGLARRSDEIVAMAENHERELPTLFSLRENDISIKRCIALSDAIAQATPDELRAVRLEIEDCRERVMTANAAVCRRMTRNPLMINAIQSGESTLFDLLLSGSREIIILARASRPFRFVLRKVLHGICADIEQQLAKSDDRILKVEIVRPEKPKTAGMGKGKQTPFMKTQFDTFKAYLDKHPVCASYSVITRARQCWFEHKDEWDKAAKNRIGYANHKNLARTV